MERGALSSVLHLERSHTWRCVCSQALEGTSSGLRHGCTVLPPASGAGSLVTIGLGPNCSETVTGSSSAAATILGSKDPRRGQVGRSLRPPRGRHARPRGNFPARAHGREQALQELALAANPGQAAVLVLRGAGLVALGSASAPGCDLHPVLWLLWAACSLGLASAPFVASQTLMGALPHGQTLQPGICGEVQRLLASASAPDAASCRARALLGPLTSGGVCQPFPRAGISPWWPWQGVPGLGAAGARLGNLPVQERCRGLALPSWPVLG